MSNTPNSTPFLPSQDTKEAMCVTRYDCCRQRPYHIFCCYAFLVYLDIMLSSTYRRALWSTKLRVDQKVKHGSNLNSRDPFLLVHICFGIKTSSLFHLNTKKIPTKKMKCSINTFKTLDNRTGFPQKLNIFDFN